MLTRDAKTVDRTDGMQWLRRVDQAMAGTVFEVVNELRMLVEDVRSAQARIERQEVELRECVGLANQGSAEVGAALRELREAVSDLAAGRELDALNAARLESHLQRMEHNLVPRIPEAIELPALVPEAIELGA